MKVSYSCKLVFSLTVTAHKLQDELPEGEAPIEIPMDGCEPECKSKKVKLICHTHLLDTFCESYRFLGSAYFNFTKQG